MKNTPPSIEILEIRIAPAAVANIDLGALNGTNGFTINGLDVEDFTGTWLGRAGDINGDGLQDLLLSAVGGDPDGVDSAGETYVIFGRAGGFGANFDLATLNGTNGFRIDGVTTDDGSGAAISGAGDVNGDGIDDLIIGAQFADPGGDQMAGSSYVVFGRRSGFGATLDLSTLDGMTGFRLDGIDPGDRAGSGVSSAGDFNGDGVGDIIIGAWFADTGLVVNHGEAYVVFGKRSGFAPVIDLATLNGTTGFTLTGIDAEDRAGQAVHGIGDFNADGFDDVLISAQGGDPNGVMDAGECYIVFGHAAPFAASISLSALNGSNGFRLNGGAQFEGVGQRIHGAGDLNRDGFDDVVLAGNSDRSYVVFGRRGPFTPAIDLTSLDGRNGFRIDGAVAGDSAGSDVGAAGDFNGDGFGDLLIAAINSSPRGRVIAGSAYVVFGKPGGFPASLNLSSLNGHNGLSLDGAVAFEGLGTVSATGDINGDGFDDILLGSGLADAAGKSDSGRAYVVYGFSDREATIAPDGHSATYLDGDGDLVTVKVSHGTLTQANFMLVPAPLVEGGSLLRRLDLSDEQFGAANLTITAKHTKLGGDGFANVGFLDATGIDLGKVVVKGDIGDLEAGAGGGTALAKLSVRTIGAYGLATQSDTGNLDWHLNGAVGAFKVAFDLKDASVTIQGPGGPLTIGGSLIGGLGDGSGAVVAIKELGAVKIGRDVVGGSGLNSGSITAFGLPTVTIGRSLLGAGGNDSGEIRSLGEMGPVKIGRDVIGGSGFASGRIASDTMPGPVSIGGSLRGGAGVSTGEVFSIGAMGKVKIAGDVLAGSGSDSGIIYSMNSLAGVSIGKSLVGGQSFQTGEIISFGNMGPVRIGRDLMGGSISGTQGSLSDSGYIAGNRIASLFIGGSIIAGLDDSAGGALFKNGSIRVNDDIGAITVKGSLVGRTNDRGDSLVIIQARGQNTLTPGRTSDTAIASLTVGGEVRNALILAGFNSTLGAANADGSIGAVKVGRNWTASSLVAGAVDSGADGFGINDALQSTSDDADLIARIASIRIKGVVTGSAAAPDHFGFVAQEIGSFKSRGFTAPLVERPAGGAAQVIELSVGTYDVTIREV